VSSYERVAPRKICPANGIDPRDARVNFDPPLGDETMESQELAKRLSELGSRIWQAIHSNDEITELLFELADAKLSLDKVHPEDTQLKSDAAEMIMGFDHDPETLDHLRSTVPPSEWLKYAIVNFALDWVLDQALMRMKIEQKWPFQEKDGFSKP
jgi:hypothetical protein